MKKLLLLSAAIAGSMITTSFATTATFAKDKEITLKKIMADPDWFGIPATRWAWTWDGKNIQYSLKRKGSVISDLYVDGLTPADKPAKVSDDLLYQHHGALSLNADRTKGVFITANNLFIRDLTTGTVEQQTYSAFSKTGAQYLTTGEISFFNGNTAYILDPKTKIMRELVALKSGTGPKEIKGPKTYVAKEQHKLIKYVSKKLQEKKDRSAHAKKLKKANPITNPKPFYMGSMTVESKSLSPDGTKMVVIMRGKRQATNKKDIMPNYIVSDASVEAKRARKRVGETVETKRKIYILDLTAHTKKELKFSDLSGFNEDVLASVKAENHKKLGKKYKSKKKTRDFRVFGTRWSSSGRNAAIMLRAFDNKDRWIASVDFASGKLIEQHRLHDTAWINWTHNRFDFLPNSETLYYQSEESGYGHLYAKDLSKKRAKAKQLTKGKFNTDNLQPSMDGKSLYYVANVDHPGNYNVYRVNIASQKSEQISDLGGLINYKLSPDQSKILIEHSSRTRPPELYIQAASTGAAAAKVTETISQEFLSYNWQIPEIIKVPASTHKRPIHARIYRPDNHKAGDKKRGVMFIHGAGYLQNSHKGWSGYFREFMFHQMLAQKGYVVMDMDWRGSKGYGRNWRTDIYRHMGKPEVDDIKDGVDWMVNNENVDRKRVGGYGGSYGGFLTLMTMFKEPDVFAAGSALRLVSDWTSYNNGYTSNILNTPQDDPIAFERSSPIYFAEGLSKPLLINAPMVDSNVFFQDSVRLVQRLIELEKTDNFETAIFPVENHGFTEPSSWLDEYRRIFKLFENNL